jgi:hypothetical protein
VRPQWSTACAIIFWRNAANQTAARRASHACLGHRPVTVYGIIDTLGPGTINTGNKPNLVYDIIVETPDQIDLAGVYEGRPPIGELVRFAQKRNFALYGKIEKKDGKTDVYRAPL